MKKKSSCLLLSLLFLCACSGKPALQEVPSIQAEPIETRPEAEAPEYGDEQQSGGTAQSSSEEDAAPWYGTWEVKDYQTTETYALSQEEIDDYLTCVLTYDANSCSVNGTPAEAGDFGYETRDCTEASIAEDYHANLGEWWNGIAQVTEVNVDPSGGFFGSHFFYVDEDTIWICQDGVFFLAKREVS